MRALIMQAVQGGHFYLWRLFSEELFKQNQFAFWQFKVKSNKKEGEMLKETG